MSVFILGIDHVETSAQLCDYLIDAVTDDDVVHAVNSLTDDDQTSSTDIRDGEQALSVVRSRLSIYTTVETHQFVSDSSPSEDLRAHAASVDADEFVIGVRGPTPKVPVLLGVPRNRLLQGAKDQFGLKQW